MGDMHLAELALKVLSILALQVVEYSPISVCQDLFSIDGHIDFFLVLVTNNAAKMILIY